MARSKTRGNNEQFSFISTNDLFGKENWLKSNWRPAMALLYLFLCTLDYAIRPIVNEIGAKDYSLAETVEIIKDLNPTVQVQIIQNASSHEKWPPILTEFVHLAFGAILTGAAITRGMEKTAKVNNPPKAVIRRNPKPDNPDEDVEEELIEEK